MKKKEDLENKMGSPKETKARELPKGNPGFGSDSSQQEPEQPKDSQRSSK